MYHRDVSHTGDLRTPPVAPWEDMRREAAQVEPRGGLLLSGPLTLGKYVSDDGVESTFGHLSLPRGGLPTSPSRWRFASSSTVRCRRSRPVLHGSGWNNHFSIRHYRGGSCSRRALRREGAAGAIAGRSARVRVRHRTPALHRRRLGQQWVYDIVRRRQGDRRGARSRGDPALQRGRHWEAEGMLRRAWMRPDQSFPTWPSSTRWSLTARWTRRRWRDMPSRRRGPPRPCTWIRPCTTLTGRRGP